MSRLPARNDRGFALLEVLIAFAIAAMALGILFRAASSGESAAHGAGQYEEAVSRAKSHMAALGHGAPLVEGESSGDDGGNYRWRIKISPIAVAAPPVNAPPPPPGAAQQVLYAVEVGISWIADGRTRELVLHSQRLGTQTGAGDG